MEKTENEQPTKTSEHNKNSNVARNSTSVADVRGKTILDKLQYNQNGTEATQYAPKKSKWQQKPKQLPDMNMKLKAERIQTLNHGKINNPISSTP